MASKSLDFIREALKSDTMECIPWPFGGTGSSYGRLWYEGRKQGAHRLVCLMQHGEPPEGKNQAAHYCGVRNCVNPRHLRWASAVDNNADKKLHGTLGRVLSEEQLKELETSTEGSADLADRFCVSKWTIRKYRKVAATLGTLSDEQVLGIRQSQLCNKQIASEFGVNEDIVSRIRRGKTHKHLSCEVSKQARHKSRCIVLNKEKAAEIRQSKLSSKELAELYGVNKSTIRRIRAGTLWKENDGNEKA